MGQPCEDLGKELPKQKEQEFRDRESGEPVMTWRLDSYRGDQGQGRGGKAVEHDGRLEIRKGPMLQAEPSRIVSEYVEKPLEGVNGKREMI